VGAVRATRPIDILVDEGGGRAASGQLAKPRGRARACHNDGYDGYLEYRAMYSYVACTTHGCVRQSRSVN